MNLTNKKSILPLILLFLFLFTSWAPAQTTVEDVRTFTLKNGMKIIVLEDHSIPNANMYIFFKVGSRNEYPGITGLSHFFEHMMFNGAKKYGPKMFDRVMEAKGGANNAYTTENITAYTDWFPSDSIEIMFELEADRIGNLALDDKMVESERGVIISERLTGLENSNFRLLAEQVKGVAFHAHPYRWSVIGYESDIKNWKKSDLQTYFDTYYAPNNAVVVIAGDVTLKRVKELTKKYFEPIPARTPPRAVYTREPEQLGEKRLHVHKNVSSPNLLITYHVPENRSKDYYALDMLDSILSEGNSSRLYKALIDDKQLAVRIRTMLPDSLDPNLYYIYAICARGVDEKILEEAIYLEIDKIISGGVTGRELQKVKNRKLMDFYHTMETINQRADAVGTYEIFFGGYEKLFNAPAEYRKVTVEDIKRVTATYFKKSNRTVGILKKIEEK
ncbi:MAG: insulinase family protein [bacterium]|nr:insulinase family protein [bacterium]